MTKKQDDQRLAPVEGGSFNGGAEPRAVKAPMLLQQRLAVQQRMRDDAVSLPHLHQHRTSLLEEPSNWRGADQVLATVTTGWPRLFLCMCLAYTVFCAWYGCRQNAVLQESHCATESKSASCYLGPATAAAAAAAATAANAAPHDDRDPLLDVHIVRFTTTLIMISRHLADALDFQQPLGQELHSWGNAFVIPAFALASGVYNASAKRSTVFRIWTVAGFACLVSLALHTGAALLFSFGPVSISAVFFHRIRYYWYLPCLFIWRALTLSISRKAESYRIPAVATFAFILALCYLGRHFFHPGFEGPSTLVFVWNRLFAFGPFFVAGALLPLRQGWLRLVTDVRVQLAGTLFFTVFHALLLVLPHFRQWHVAGCFEPGSCEFHLMGGHFPRSALYAPYSALGAVDDLILYGAMLAVTMSGICLVGGAVAFGAEKFPRLLALCAACGSRALLALVLHVPLVELAAWMKVEIMASHVPERLRALLLFVFSLQVMLVFTCDATASILTAIAAPLLPQETENTGTDEDAFPKGPLMHSHKSATSSLRSETGP